MADGPAGIPMPLLALAVIVVGVLIFLSKSRPKNRRMRAAAPVKEEKPDITTLIGKPESHKEPQQVKSVEDMLAGDIDDAPSIGDDTKTEIGTSLGLLKIGEREEPPKTEKKANKTPKPEKAPEEIIKDPSIDLDEFEDELEEPEDYMQPPDVIPAKVPKAPPPAPGSERPELIEVRKELEKGLTKSVKGEPGTLNERNAKRLCMECFDNDMSPVKVMAQLRKRDIPAGKAKELVNDMYKLWLAKRESILVEIKEVNERIKRIHYKFLKRQIDEKTRRDMLIENQKRLVELEAKLKATDHFFLN